MGEKTGTSPSNPLRWAWIALLAAAALAALDARELVTLIRWERTLIFARDLLPSAIAMASMKLAAYLAIIGLVLARRTRKWGLALGIGWGVIITGASVWTLVGPYAKNVWQELLLRAHLTHALIRYEVVGSTGRRMAAWIAGLGAVFALGSGKGFADCPRDRLDRGVVMASFFYAAVYYLVMAFVARFVTPR